MRLLVVGRSGQLAHSLAELARDYPALTLDFAGRPELDLEAPGSAAAAIRAARADLVINAAAYTAVDKAESEPDRARRINEEAVSEIAEAAHGVGAPLIHLSTDYVFAGQGDAPMTEVEPVAPLGVYGRTKAGGENAVRAAAPDHLILRTAWVYSPFGTNFAKTMLRFAAEREEVGVVVDQIGSPTCAFDLARTILNLARRRGGGDMAGWGDTYHCAGRGQASWAEFAAAIMEESASLGGPFARIRPITTAEYPTPVRRPAWSVLDSGKLERTFGLCMPDWRDSLRPVIRRLVRPG